MAHSLSQLGPCDLDDVLTTCGEEFGNNGGASPRFYMVRKLPGVQPTFDTLADGSVVVTDIAFDANTVRFAQIDARIETAGATAPLVGAQGAGSTYLEQTVVFSLDGVKGKKLEFLKKVASGGEYMIIMQTRTKGDVLGANQYLLLGSPNGLTISAAAGGFGVKRADAVGWDYTLVAGNDSPGIPLVYGVGFPHATINAFLTAICENPLA